jgi:hypothetical protein
VENFTVENQFGKIVWEGKTNLENVDFKKKKINIYEYEIECTIPEL